VQASNSVYTQEIFGPAMCVVETDTLDQAIAFINANPNGNGTSIFTSSGWAGAVPERDRRGPGGHQRGHPRARRLLQLHGLARVEAGRPGPNGKQALYFWTQTKTVTARWFAPDDGGSGVNTTIAMK
jgi:malonate-semialdehyde dehydrogenase (acetylating)/methylmalonate-semialdehyde dehydrogenase